MRYRILLLVLFACLHGRLHAQDPHFTQAHRLSSWYNPATVGTSAESLRIAALYRNQWASVTSPFRTEGFFVEKHVREHGLGFNMVNNHAGSTGFRQLYAGGQWSLTKQVGKNLLSAGLHLGILQRSFDPSNMTFDEQYSADQGSAAATPHTENFAATSKLRPDAGLGFLWRYAGDVSGRFTPFAGAGATHLNQPRETFILDEGSIEPRYTLQAGTGYRISESVSLASLIQFSKQSLSREFMASVRGQIKLNETSDLEGLVLFRNADALALGIAYRWSQYSIGMSYDVNVSGITGTPGAAEIMLVYTPEVRTRNKREKNTVEKKADKPTELIAAVTSDEKSSAASDSTTTTTLSQAIATILPSIESKNESVPASPPANRLSTPDLADILAAFADGGNNRTAPVEEKPNPDLQHEPSIQPMVPLPVKQFDIEPTFAFEIAGSHTGKPMTTDMPYGTMENGTDAPFESKTVVEQPVVLNRNAQVNHSPDKIEFDQWIGFENGSRNVHGLYKLDVIEPALDLLLNDSTLNLELSMPVPDGQTIRKGIVKEVFVTKGLEPARIRILTETPVGAPSSAGYAGAVRVRILREQ